MSWIGRNNWSVRRVRHYFTIRDHSESAVKLATLKDDRRDGVPVRVEWNGKELGRPHGGQMGFGFHQLIAHAARTRNLSAGTILGSGTISNSEYRTIGSACIAERRSIEISDHGKPSTPFMKFGDRVRIDMRDARGASIFGAIDQRIVQVTLP